MRRSADQALIARRRPALAERSSELPTRPVPRDRVSDPPVGRPVRRTAIRGRERDDRPWQSRHAVEARLTSSRRQRPPDELPLGLATRLPKPAIVYQCPECDNRYLGQQRCEDCRSFCRRLGPGGPCPHCDEAVAVTDLLTHNPGSDESTTIRQGGDAPTTSQSTLTT